MQTSHASNMACREITLIRILLHLVHEYMSIVRIIFTVHAADVRFLRVPATSLRKGMHSVFHSKDLHRSGRRAESALWGEPLSRPPRGQRIDLWQLRGCIRVRGIVPRYSPVAVPPVLLAEPTSCAAEVRRCRPDPSWWLLRGPEAATRAMGSPAARNKPTRVCGERLIDLRLHSVQFVSLFKSQ